MPDRQQAARPQAAGQALHRALEIGEADQVVAARRSGPQVAVPEHRHREDCVAAFRRLPCRRTGGFECHSGVAEPGQPRPRGGDAARVDVDALDVRLREMAAQREDLLPRRAAERQQAPVGAVAQLVPQEPEDVRIAVLPRGGVGLEQVGRARQAQQRHAARLGAAQKLAQRPQRREARQPPQQRLHPGDHTRSTPSGQ